MSWTTAERIEIALGDTDLPTDLRYLLTEAVDEIRRLEADLVEAGGALEALRVRCAP